MCVSACVCVQEEATGNPAPADTRQMPASRCCQTSWFGEYRTAATLHAKCMCLHTVNATDENISENHTVR